MSEPLPGNFGLANWVDYVNYWRESDAEWIQARINVRAQDNTQRDGFSVTPGQVVYNAATDRLELRTATNTWRPQTPFPASLAVAEGATTTISHTASSGKGVVFGPTEVAINHQLNVLGGVLTVPADSSGVVVKTGAKSAKLSTSATDLVSDSPVSVPSLTLTGAGTVINAPAKTAVVGVVTADTVGAVTVNVSGVLTAGSGTVGGVAMAANVATASGGHISQGGIHYGDASSAIVRYRNPSGGALGAAYLQVNTGAIEVVGGAMNVRTGMTVSDTTISYYSAGAFRGYISPAFYGDPGVANVPEGSILIQ